MDSDLHLAQITDENMRWLDRAEPYGFGNPEPVFSAAGLKLSSQPRVLKEKHLRLALRQEGSSITAVGWNMGDRAASLEPGALLDAAFTVEADDFAGGWRIVLRDLVTR